MFSELKMSFFMSYSVSARYGVYHMLISALPSIAPRLDKLRNGTMQVCSAAWGISFGRLLMTKIAVP